MTKKLYPLHLVSGEEVVDEDPTSMLQVTQTLDLTTYNVALKMQLH
jgi:hypothetical protein